MKSGISWNLRGVDDETREAVTRAANRAGMSVAEWLTEVLAEGTSRGTAAPDTSPRQAEQIRQLATAIEKLNERLGAMDDGARSAISGLKDRLDAIDVHVNRLSDARSTEGERARSLKGVSAMVEDLAREIDNADERARSMIEGGRRTQPPPDTNLDRINDAIRELDERIASMGTTPAARAPAPPPVPAPTHHPAPLDDIRQQLSALLQQQRQPETPSETPASEIERALKALEHRIDDERERIAQRDHEAQEIAAATAEQINRVDARLADIAEQLAHAEAERRKPQKEAQIATAIREITAHQRTIDDRAEAAALRRDQKALAAAMAALRADIGGLTEQVNAISRIGAEEQGAFYELARRIDALAADHPVDRNLLAAMRDELQAMRALVEDDERQDQLNALGAQVAALREAFENDDSPRAIQRLEHRIVELGQAMEATLSRPTSDPAIERLEYRLAEIGQSLEEKLARPVSDPAIERLEGRLHDIAARVDGLHQANAGAQAAALQTVEQNLEYRLAELASRIDGAVDNATRPQAEAIASAQHQLEGRLEDIVHRLGALAEGDAQRGALTSMQERLEAITERIDGLSAQQSEPAQTLMELRGEIGALRSEITDREAPALSTEHLENQIRELAQRLETVAVSKDDGALADLEARVSHLAEELEQNTSRTSALAQVEERLDRMQALLSDTAEESVAKARAEARDAVNDLAAMVSDNTVDSRLIRGLMRDLDELRSAASTSNDGGRSELETVSATLSEVVDRLGRLEKETTAAEDKDAALPAPAEAAGPRPLPSSWTSVFSGLGPSAGKTAAPTPVVTTQSAAEPAPGADKTGHDRRADFIAAARRAAQAAAQETRPQNPARHATVEDDHDDDATQPPTDDGQRKPGAFERISQAIRNRRRPLLLAAAAIVLAVGALQVYGLLVPAQTADDSPVAAMLAEPQPPAKDTARLEETDNGAIETSLASNTATAMPGAIDPALTPPAEEPDPAIAFAPPEVSTGQFGGAAPQTAAASDAPAADADAMAMPAPTLVSAPATPSGLDPKLGPQKLLAAADSGDPAAAFEIATRYAEGSVVPKDLSKAAEWYKKAAEGGVAVAQYRLASLYERGQGVTKDLTNAVNWYQRAADQGNINAMHNLAVLMSEGTDSGPDHEKALQWFLAAGNYGVRDSQYNLGVIYARGLGTTPNLIESYKWFAIAAKQGDSDAGARRDEVADVLDADNLAKAKAEVAAWKVKAPIADANGVSAPAGGWGDSGMTIAQADRDALVKKIQTLLADQGYDVGPADGVAGPKTVAAVKEYQRKLGADPTGQIDNTLVASLTGAN